MNVLLTGASGFLGSRIYARLRRQHSITTLGRTADESSSAKDQHIFCDLSNQVPILPRQSIDLVVNAAGKAHAVPRNAADRTEYERINVQGTARLLTALEKASTLPKALVHISTVLVYGRSEGELLDENTPLNAEDVYGLSKIKAEQLVRQWSDRTGVRITILRLPLVAAEQPTGNLAAMMDAIRRGYYVRIANNMARRSMVRADDVAAVMIRAAEKGGTFNLTDGYHPSVWEIETAFMRLVGRSHLINMPLSVAKTIGKVGDGIATVTGRRFPFDSSTYQKLTSSLTFSDEAARQQLNWNPRPVLNLFL
ncbi:NAD-dependent epimerase/dehydratase family protein [Spirosoma soli]|uniref:NAD-dependent epimerase/dehydratase family protein n=1 Tax=Spirosoma soli TaxID=1770529 RepID=A0ABW5MA56_9BACT